MSRIINKILSVLLIVMLVNITLIVLWQVFSRFVMNKPSSFTEELSRYHLIWISLLGAAYITGQRLNLAIDLMSEQLSDVWKIKLSVVTHILVALFAFVVMFIGGLNLVKLTLDLNQVSASMPLKIGYIYAVLPLSGALIVYYSVLHIRKLIKP